MARGKKLTAEEVKTRLERHGYILLEEYKGVGPGKRISVFCTTHNQKYEVPSVGVISGGKHLPCCGRESISKKMTGRPVSDAFKLACSTRQKGGKAYWSGKSFTKEHRAKISSSGAKVFSTSIDRHIGHANRGVTAGKPGWFYIFRVGDLLKFGSVSRMTPEQRMAKVRRDTGLPCSIEMAVKVDDAGGYEAAMMNRCREHWVRHEYFSPSLLPGL